ncbi:MAG: hypothetical protein ACD_40C00033G0002 [uncultured bacterium]|nr:MAG: hypothetical protein ACD_40C00033G0002 [uncultured bacterium]
MSYSLRRATGWNLAGYLYLLLASFATTPTLIRALGIPAYGQYALSLALAGLISTLDLGLPRAVVYFLSQSGLTPSKRQEILNSSLFAFSLLGFLFFLPAAIFHSLSLGILIWLNFLLAHYLSLPESRGDFARVNLRNFLVGTANTVGAMLVALAGFGVTGILYLLSFSTLLTIILVYVPAHPFSSRQTLKAFFVYGVKSWLGKLVGSVQGQYAKFLLASSPLALASYTLGSSLISRLVGGVTQVSTALFPYSVSARGNSRFRHLYLRLQLSLVLLGVLATLLYQAFGLPFLSWWLGDYSLAASVHSFLLIYRFYALLLLLTPLASTVIDSLGKPLMTSFLGLATLVIEVTFTWVYLPQLGLLSPAYGALLSLILIVPVLLIYTERILRQIGNLSRSTPDA